MSSHDHSEQIWAYLHGEMSLENRRSFEREMAASPDLKSEFESLQSLHQKLEANLPLADAQESEEARTERYLSAIECEPSGADRARAAAPAEVPFAHPEKSLARWFQMPALAAAALLLILVGVPSVLRRGEIVWLSSDLGGVPEFRGEQGGRPAAVYTDDEKRRLADDVQQGVETAYRAVGGGSRTSHRLRVKLQEFPNGALLVRVEDVTRGGEASRAWELFCDSRADVTARLPAFGRNVGGALRGGTDTAPSGE